MATNRAAWVDGPGKPIRVDVHELGAVGPGEVLVKNRAVAINPADCLLQLTGGWVEKWPTILGYDLAGEVIQVEAGVEHVYPGQRVLACALQLSLKDSGFQENSIVRADVVTPVPETMSFQHAAVIPLALATAAAALYKADQLSLPLPRLGTVPKIGNTILIWGGSSSVGCAAIQLAAASGLDVVTTASERNFDLCRSLGAKQVYDRNSPNIKQQLIEGLGKTRVAGAFAAISTFETVTIVADVISSLGGGFISTTKAVPDNLPENVSAKMVGATDYVAEEGRKFFVDYLPAALTSGAYKAMPEPCVIGDGLESIQLGIEALSKGVSAQKIVVNL